MLLDVSIPKSDKLFSIIINGGSLIIKDLGPGKEMELHAHYIVARGGRI